MPPRGSTEEEKRFTAVRVISKWISTAIGKAPRRTIPIIFDDFNCQYGVQREDDGLFRNGDREFVGEENVGRKSEVSKSARERALAMELAMATAF